MHLNALNLSYLHCKMEIKTSHSPPQSVVLCFKCMHKCLENHKGQCQLKDNLIINYYKSTN